MDQVQTPVVRPAQGALFPVRTGYVRVCIMSRGHKYLQVTDRGLYITHRENGPALVYPNGEVSFWEGNSLHREGGPSIYSPHLGRWVRYHIKDEWLTEEDFLQRKLGVE